MVIVARDARAADVEPAKAENQIEDQEEEPLPDDAVGGWAELAASQQNEGAERAEDAEDRARGAKGKSRVVRQYIDAELGKSAGEPGQKEHHRVTSRAN